MRKSPLLPALAAVLCIAAGVRPAAGDGAHLGVASCATSVCHGKGVTKNVDPCNPHREEDVNLKEFSVWQQCDRHSGSYLRLRDNNPLAQRIAQNLGLANPWNQKLCLDCHADNAFPGKDKVGKFRLADGVGCEACHGGAENWIDTHKDPKATHAENIQHGMYPTEQPMQRAQLCLSCHLGTKDKFATHSILGAGHPRLSFELEVFTRLQPAHYVIDEAYVKRKGRIEGMNLWVTGQLENSERFLSLLQSDWYTKAGAIVPEFAFYDCFGCHHPVENKNNQRWSQARSGPGIGPGTLRLQRQNLLMLQALAETIAPQSLADLKSDTESLLRAGQADAPAMRAAAQKLLVRVRTCDAWSTRSYTAQEVAAVRRALLRYAADDRTSEFAAAEQVVLGVDSLSHSLNDADRRKQALDALYDAVKSADNFNAAQFAAVSKRVQGQF
jgi:cytochrome c554/c'-like protein